MAAFGLLAAGFLMKFMAGIFLICAIVLILVILIQKGRGGGLSGVLGGGMAGGLLGTKTGDFLTWVTIVLVGVFLTLSVVIAKFYKPSISKFGPSQPVRQSEPIGPEQPAAVERPFVPVEAGDTGVDVNIPVE